jgi:carbon monoxide dehydrogenase subunit G
MRLEQSFEVPVPVAQAWGVLLDVERIAPCMPGATLTGFNGDTFTGLVKVKLGPVSLAYKGSGRFADKDEAGKRVVIVASGQDSRGNGAAQARVTAVLHQADGGAATLVKVVADLDIAGRVASMGRGLIADVSAKLIQQFAEKLAATIAAEPVAAAAPVAAPVAVPAPAPAPVIEAIGPEPVAEAEPFVPANPVTVPPPDEMPPPPPAEEYHPLALEEPALGYSTTEVLAEPMAEPSSGPEPVSEYAYDPEPAPSPIEPTVADVAPTASAPIGLTKPAVEGEAVDLLALGAKATWTRFAPFIIIVGIVIVAAVVWAIVV